MIDVVEDSNGPLVFPIGRRERGRTTESSRVAESFETVSETLDEVLVENSPLGSVWDEWRTVPHGAPSLLLAGNHHLDMRTAGPVLRPGVRYRVDGFRNGVVALRTKNRDGSTGFGFCNSVDLICMDRRFTIDRLGTGPRQSGLVGRITARVRQSLRERS